MSSPVLECVTREERVCHTSYLTQYNTVQQHDCQKKYEKKCDIVMRERQVSGAGD